MVKYIHIIYELITVVTRNELNSVESASESSGVAQLAPVTFGYGSTKFICSYVNSELPKKGLKLSFQFNFFF